MKFYQLWTIFISVGRHSLAAKHCLLTGKNQYLYQAILESVRHNIPHFRPQASMSDSEEGPRNAFRVTYPQLKLYECWFHVTQRIWAKTQELSLVVKTRNWKIYIKTLMSIPFMPHPSIIPTFDFIQMPTNVENSDKIKLEKLKKYFKRRWTIRISPEEAKHCNQQRSRNLPFKTQNQHTCSQRIQDLGQSCPICRSNIENMFQTLIN